MTGSDKWFRWCFNLFIFLMCVQLGMAIALRGIYQQAQQRMDQNTAVVDFKCGDFNNDNSYWQIPTSAEKPRLDCSNGLCPESYWKSSGLEVEDTHVIAVQKPQPSRMEDGKLVTGHFVELQVQDFNKPTSLVLVSQEMLQWNFVKYSDGKKLQKFDEIKNLKEVIVVGADLIWIESLPKDVKVTYFTKEQVCAYPVAWNEADNSSNQYRRLLKALKAYNNLQVTSFQGRTIARKFQVPYRGFATVYRPSTRDLASRSEAAVNSLSTGIEWRRKDQQLVAQNLKYLEQDQVKTQAVPAKTSDAFFEAASKKLFLIQNFQFGYFDASAKQFKVLHVPLKLPAMYWPRALAFNPLKSEIYIYNEDRGGEIYSYNVVTQQWRFFAQGVGYSLVSLLFDSDSETLHGVKSFGQKITEVVGFDNRGLKTSSVALKHDLDFAKQQWRAQLMRSGKDHWLKISHPAHPGGDLHAISLPQLTN